MRILLDTHSLLWWLAEPDRLGKKAMSCFLDEQNELILSSVTSWEITIKVALKRLKLPKEPAKIFSELFQEGQFKGLAIDHLHTLKTLDLPFHHYDPFDRLLIAQAITESLPIMTADKQFKKYPVKIIPAA